MSFEKQTLAPDLFEVVIVDDGSQPAVDLAALAHPLPFELRIVRRDSDHGAHASRFAGLRAARGRRVVFLDDDIAATEGVFEAHASSGDSLAMGPIFYHPSCEKTPYQRFQSKRYAEEVYAIEKMDGAIPAYELYICNSSAPTSVFLQHFESLERMYTDTHMGGDGFDEGLLSNLLRSETQTVKFLRNAVVLHMDHKTTADGQRERRMRGALECRLILNRPELRKDYAAYDVLTGNGNTLKEIVLRTFWRAPIPFVTISNFLRYLTDTRLGRWLPSGLCRIPISIAFWTGMRSEAPSYRKLRATLLENPGARD